MGKKLHFKVSARTARLIGRENVSNAESALIELVKNSYDADAENCIIYFDKNNQVHILDDGHGMTNEIIEDYWMTIGTNNKGKDYVTKSKRIKSGEKGIGRFALDRLGGTCDLWTKPENNSLGYVWKADWKDFENDELQTVEQIEADLETHKNLALKDRVSDIFSGANMNYFNAVDSVLFDKGTSISIDKLHDEWNLFRFNRLYKSLSTLIPPKEETVFEVYLFVEEHPDQFGKISSGPCDDFDYKVSAEIDESQNSVITITRNEHDLERLDDDLFKRKSMQNFPYDKATFLNKIFVLNKTLGELVPGFKDSDNNEVFNNIGAFTFTYYFMKKNTDTKNSERFCYKEFNSSLRKQWLDEHGGIKIFRDGFRVRPYGEPDGNSLDWLGLGARYSGSPAGVARKGDYRVREYNLSGSVKISRVNNPALRDKSSREGIQENQEFDVFKQILIGIINLFEYDRSYIASELAEFYESKNPRERTAKKAEAATKRAKDKKNNEHKSEAEADVEVLTQHTEDLKEEIKELLNEQKILRVLASSGAMFAAFGHELYAIKNEVRDRADTLRYLFQPYLDVADSEDIPDEHNPWIYVDEVENLDTRLLHWMNFALSGLKKDKRNRKVIFLDRYLNNLEALWSIFLDEREIKLNIDCKNKDLKFKAFEVELDTVFNNLLLNSIEVFNKKIRFDERKIHILCKNDDDLITIHYRDSGTGLSEDIDNPDRIFDMFYSTKRDPNTGKEIGTGIGMYLVKSVVNEYGGNISFGKAKNGFSLSITIPRNY